MPATFRTILVTGATGIIGRHAVRRLLQKGLHVVAVARSSFERVPLACETRQVDLLDLEATQTLVRQVKPDALLHLAWITTHGHFWNTPENLDWLASSIHLLRSFAEAGGQRIVGAGTCVEYDTTRSIVGPIAENALCSPATLYGITKHALHQLFAAYAQKMGLGHAWGRLFLLYGEDEPEQRLAPSVIRALLSGQPAACTSGNQIRDFLDCRDAGAAFAELLLSDASGAINICSGKAVTVADFAMRIAAIIGRPDLLRLGALPNRQDDPPFLVGDSNRLLQEVGFHPAFSLDTGLHHTIDYWRRRAIQ